MLVTLSNGDTIDLRSVNMSDSSTIQSRPACLAASDADPALTAVPACVHACLRTFSADFAKYSWLSIALSFLFTIV